MYEHRASLRLPSFLFRLVHDNATMRITNEFAAQGVAEIAHPEIFPKFHRIREHYVDHISELLCDTYKIPKYSEISEKNLVRLNMDVDVTYARQAMDLPLNEKIDLCVSKTLDAAYRLESMVEKVAKHATLMLDDTQLNNAVKQSLLQDEEVL